MAELTLADRAGVMDAVIAYADAVDRLDDPGAVAACFTPQGVLDLSCAGVAPIAGHDALRAFFTGSFAGAAHHAHHVSNFAFGPRAGDSVQAVCHVLGRVIGKDGSSLTIHGRYRLEMQHTAAGWRIARLTMELLLPL